MKTIKNTLYFVLCTVVLIALGSCEPRALTEEDVFFTEDQVAELTSDGQIYHLNDFLDQFMTEQGNFASDTCPYRERSYDATHELYLYSVDTIPTNGPGVYIRGRITTDDYSGNFYKAMVIQEVVNGVQQNLRISVDLGSSHGLYQMGQEIIIRCNGLAVGRYANQPQLCIPSYNNNIYAMNANQKVGWCPGRIQASVFRRATHLIGKPDRSQLKYDEYTLSDLYRDIDLKPALTEAGMDAVRKADGRLIIIRNVHFTGEFDNNGTLAKCDTLHPDSSSNANVFAPTTDNIGYPQSRVLQDNMSNKIMCSSSEYSKFAHFYLPGADRHGVTDCPNWTGSVTGILGWYLDKASTLASNKLTGYEWSVTPRGIPGIGISDIEMYNDHDDPWIPTEYDPRKQ